MGKKEEKIFQDFLRLVFKLDGIELFGLARLLGVTFNSQSGEVKEFEEVFRELKETFSQLDYIEKRKIIKIIKQELRDKEINLKRFKEEELKKEEPKKEELKKEELKKEEPKEEELKKEVKNGN